VLGAELTDRADEAVHASRKQKEKKQ